MKCIASESVPLSKRKIWDIKKQEQVCKSRARIIQQQCYDYRRAWTVAFKKNNTTQEQTYSLQNVGGF
jgi:hypothetical protein